MFTKILKKKNNFKIFKILYDIFAKFKSMKMGFLGIIKITSAECV